jgi:hypothetical protein
MNKLILLTLFLFSSHYSWANECRDSLSKLGIEVKTIDVFSHCFNQSKMNSLKKSIYISESSKLEIVGYENAIFISNEEKGLKQITSGLRSKLSNVLAIAVGPTEKEIFSLENETGLINVFPAIYGGNLSPVRQVKLESLVGANDIAVTKKNLYVLVVGKKKIYIYDKNINTSTKVETFKKDALVKSIDLNISDVDSIQVKDGKVLLIDKNQSIISEINTLD